MNKKTLRVAMLINGYPRIGGAERVLAELCPFLHQQHIAVHIVTRRYAGQQSYEEIDGVPVHRLPIPGPRAVASLTFTMTTLPLLRHLRPHVMHAHEIFSATTTAVLAKSLIQRPVVVTAHRSGTLGDLYRLQHAPFGKARLAIFRRSVDAFTAISHEIEGELAASGIPPERCHFIPNGIDTGRFVPPPGGKAAARRALPDLPQHGTIAVFSGRLSPEKRVHHLLRIWPTIRTAHPDAHLLILGTGSEEATLRQQAGAGVHFTGGVDDVLPYLQAADIFVLPSIAEGLSIALLEAQSVGLACVATSVGGAPDMITHMENGLLVPPDEPAALQQALLALLNDETLRGHISQNSRERVQRDYPLSRMAARLRDLYDHLNNVVP